jgi:hypothetical protein
MKDKTFLQAVRLRTAACTLCGCLSAIGAQLTVSAAAFAQSASDLSPSMTRDAEIALALSACPPNLAAQAAVYVLGKSGYIKIRDSANGFTAIVQHSVPDAQEPQCMDEEGARTFLPRILMVAELRAQGKSRDEVRCEVAEALARGVLQPSKRFVDYMLSNGNMVPNQTGSVTPFPPHIMFYGPYLTNADIGVDNANLGPDGNPAGPVFVAGEGTPYALVIVSVGAHGGMGHAMPDFAPGSNR